MLTSVTIEGFKSIAERVTVELGRVNVFIGANASGKSALLEAIGVLGAAASGRVDDAALSLRGVRPGVPALYKSALKGRRYRPFISLRAEWEQGSEKAVYEVGLDNPIEKPEPAWRYRTESVWRGSKLLPGYSRSPRTKILPVDRYTGLAARGLGTSDFKGTPEQLIRGLDQFAIFAPTTGALRGIVPDVLQRAPVGLLGGGLAEGLQQTLTSSREDRKRLPLGSFLQLLDWVQGTGVTPTPPSRKILSPSVPAPRLTVGFIDRFMRGGRNLLTAYDASEGALYVLFLAVLVLHRSTPPIFAIDNFDYGMHPRLARAATRVLCEQLVEARPPRQVILTTHNPLVLDGLNIQNAQVRLFAVERGASGATQVHRITISPELIAEAENGMTLSRLWVMGRLGAVPNV